MRYWITAVLSCLALVVGGCSLISPAAKSVEQGDCVKQDGADFATVECSSAEAKYVVLKKLSGSEYTCKDVAGVTYTYYEDKQVCLGDKGADPLQASNVAHEGDCLTDSSSPPVRKLPCGDPQSIYKVLAREDGGLASLACDSVPGTEVTYTWELKQIGDGKKIPKLGPDLIFCLAHKEVDTARALENAKVGDCLRDTNIKPNLETTDCGGADAKYRVLRVVATSGQCDNVQGATSSFTFTPGGLAIPRVFCVARLR
ncbi:hypothetical protein DFR70_101609 [Nocardia tenerifensis]|uniref:Lipoprotein n=1 Tax=Nocardia tenerifensis TaxID=228006 RepID=A0A318KBD4_9NOCA|nr:hypothetical protein [Nocardia tenerifensis]PXX71187.1 hypothetical protein DFR70_101609 [Nocardia tenerifensis]